MPPYARANVSNPVRDAAQAQTHTHTQREGGRERETHTQTPRHPHIHTGTDQRRHHGISFCTK
jgi:hypothetical protein